MSRWRRNQLPMLENIQKSKNPWKIHCIIFLKKMSTEEMKILLIHCHDFKQQRHFLIIFLCSFEDSANQFYWMLLSFEDVSRRFLHDASKILGKWVCTFTWPWLRLTCKIHLWKKKKKKKVMRKFPNQAHLCTSCTESVFCLIISLPSDPREKNQISIFVYRLC